MEILHVRVSDQEREDFVHFWRVIGHLIGVKDEANPCQWGADASIKLVISYLKTYWIYSPDFKIPKNMSQMDLEASKKLSFDLSLGVLSAASKITYSPISFLLAISRILMSNFVMDKAGFPKVNILWMMMARAFLLMLSSISLFTRIPIIGEIFFSFYRTRFFQNFEKIKKKFSNDVRNDPLEPS
jgi:hypothetical protein